MTSLHAELHNKLLTDEGHLTKQQQEVVTHDGNGVVRACPGSGKTRALAARLAYRMSAWQSERTGIAALSFTNVAVDELKDAMRFLGIAMPDASPHFVGTIDSFIYQHVTGPHLSSIIKGMDSRPELILHGQDSWVQEYDQFVVKIWIDGKKAKFPYRVPVTRYFLKPDRRVTWNPDRKERNMGIRLPDPTEVLKKKVALAKSGHISVSDSMFYARAILKKFAWLADALASRYPQIVIDECQDTSDVQNEIISLLVATGKTQVMMIGDPYQAIYEFNDADPQLMLDRIKNDKWHQILLMDNFRSSGKICTAINEFFHFSDTMSPKGECEKCQIEPVSLRYPDKDIGKLPSIFSEMLTAIDATCSITNVKIVTRSAIAVRELRRLAGEVDNVGYCTMRLMTAAVFRDEGSWTDAFRNAQACLCRLVLDQAGIGQGHRNLGKIDYRAWRRLVWLVVSSLPGGTEDLDAWIPKSRECLKQRLAEAGIDPIHKPSDRIRRPSSCPSIPVASIVAAGGPSTDGPLIDTVHKVKGQTLDGIMLVASPSGRSRPSSVVNWLPSGNGEEPSEEKRIAYVAMSRPKRLLVVAIPDSAWGTSASFFAHFRQVESSDLSSLKGLCQKCGPVQD